MDWKDIIKDRISQILVRESFKKWQKVFNFVCVFSRDIEKWHEADANDQSFGLLYSFKLEKSIEFLSIF